MNSEGSNRPPVVGGEITLREIEKLPLRDALRVCIQCGTCSSSCPSARAMDYLPRRMWRLVQVGLTEEVLRSKSMWLCTLCYQCQVRCPRGIPLTDTITELKQLALERGTVGSPESAAFYRVFTDVFRRYGRIRELELMARYFLATNPLGAMAHVGLGLTLLRRGKIRPQWPQLTGKGRLDALLARVKEIEGQR